MSGRYCISRKWEAMPWIEKGSWVGNMDGCSSVEHCVFIIVRIASHWSSVHVVLLF